MKLLSLFAFGLLPLFLPGQPWVDTTYAITTVTDLSYGFARDFAGVDRELKLDLSYPVNDTPPACGRPLLVMVHGGAWIAGDKTDGFPTRIREDFAKRGYATAAVSYRLGQFHTNQFVNCNVPGWNCWNMTDSSEWYRAHFRAIQDVNGAIRYLVDRADTYGIDPNNVFVVGESAGGFAAMGVGYLDDDGEVLSDLVGARSDAPPPNALYETECIQNLGLADAIATMTLSRPALGSYAGSLHHPATTNYVIRGVGNFYGGAFNDIFRTHGESAPALYLYHQPCDLIVPFGYSRLLAGYTNCLTGFPTFCGFIVNRPFVYGSQGIKSLIDTLAAAGLPTATYYFDATQQQFNCLQQATNPGQSCHAVDNYVLRTGNMARFFADQLSVCTASPTAAALNAPRLYPNPATRRVTVAWDRPGSALELSIHDTLGRVVFRRRYGPARVAEIDVRGWAAGVYVLSLRDEGYRQVMRLVVE